MRRLTTAIAAVVLVLVGSVGVAGCDGSGTAGGGKGSTVKAESKWKDPDYRAQVAHATALKVAQQVKPGYEFPAKAKDEHDCKIDGYPHNRSTTWGDNLGKLDITGAWLKERVVPWLEAEGWSVDADDSGFSAEKHGMYVACSRGGRGVDATWGIGGNSGCDY